MMQPLSPTVLLCPCPTVSPAPSSDFNTQLPSPRVPVEIIDRIVAIFLSSPHFVSKLSRFSTIASFTLASMDFRQIALRHYFQEITLLTRGQWAGLFSLLQAQEDRMREAGKSGGFAWVRALHASSKVLSQTPIRLRSLQHLRILSIDMAQDGLSTQHPCITNLFQNLEPTNACQNLTSLTLSSLPRIDVLLLGYISNKFPGLLYLNLSCTERIEFGCCWACFEDSLGCTLHSPVPDDYSDVTTMAMAFATTLQPLKYLTHLHLGVFLSDDQLLSSHIAHSLGDGDNFGAVANWSKCQPCLNKAIEEVKFRELEASVVIGQKLKSLRTIGWSSLFVRMTNPDRVEQHIDSDDTVEDVAFDAYSGTDCGDDDDDDILINEHFKAPNFGLGDNMKTTILISRSGGQLRALRTE